MQLDHFSLETEQSLSAQAFKVIELNISPLYFQDLDTKPHEVQMETLINVSISSSTTINYTKKTQQFLD